VRSARVAILASVALAVAACGGGDDKAAPTASSSGPTSASSESSGSTSSSSQEPGFEVSDIAAGDQHVCALDRDGVAYCWGYNRMGQLGNGSGADSSTPVKVTTDQRFESISAGRYFSCALTAGGAAFCWGDNSSGELGDGTTGAGGDDENRATPVQVLGGLAFEELVTGQLHVCGRTAAGEVHCWGAYPSGQLGNDANTDQVQPLRSAAGLVFTELAASGANTCGLEAAGAAWCWGNNSFGQLGNGAKSNAAQHAPGQVIGGTRFVSLTLGRTHGCGIDAVGAASCWGGNVHGVLGDGTLAERLTPTPVAGTHRFAMVSGGVQHTCGIDTDGAAWCWGANHVGQLGDGSGTDGEDRTSPTAVTGGLRFATLSAGEEFTCGITTDDLAYCWGANTAGLLGDGSDRGTTEPVRVKRP